MDTIDFSAHAYLLNSTDGDALYRLIGILHERGIETKGNPDCFMREFGSFSVDDAREITAFASLKPIGERKYIVIAVQSMTPEAQNALLKVVEEGSGHSVFFFLLPPGVPALSTLESRCVTIKMVDNKQKTKEGEDFLKMSYADRLGLAEKFAKDHNRDGARALVRSLLALAVSQNGRRPTSTILAVHLRDLLDADRYLQLSGSSPKAVIGHLALTL